MTFFNNAGQPSYELIGLFLFHFCYFVSSLPLACVSALLTIAEVHRGKIGLEGRGAKDGPFLG